MGGPDDEMRRTRRTYDAVAAEFLERTRDRGPMQEALDRFRAGLGAGALVLDVGSGPGTDSAELRARGLRVVSVDLSLGMLKAGLASLPGLRVQADMRRLPFGRVADGLWANASLLHLRRDEFPAALRELGRVLRRHGLLHVGVKRGCREGFEEERYGPGLPRYFTFWEAADLDAALRAAGFRIESATEGEGVHDPWLQRLARLE